MALGFCCRQLGFVTGSVSNEIIPTESGMKGWLKEVDCQGGETRLEFCDLGVWNQYDCSGQRESTAQCSEQTFSVFPFCKVDLAKLTVPFESSNFDVRPLGQAQEKSLLDLVRLGDPAQGSR